MLSPSPYHRPQAPETLQNGLGGYSLGQSGEYGVAELNFDGTGPKAD